MTPFLLEFHDDILKGGFPVRAGQDQGDPFQEHNVTNLAQS